MYTLKKNKSAKNQRNIQKNKAKLHYIHIANNSKLKAFKIKALPPKKKIQKEKKRNPKVRDYTKVKKAMSLNCTFHSIQSESPIKFHSFLCANHYKNKWGENTLIGVTSRR